MVEMLRSSRIEHRVTGVERAVFATHFAIDPEV